MWALTWGWEGVRKGGYEGGREGGRERERRREGGRSEEGGERMLIDAGSSMPVDHTGVQCCRALLG